MNLLEPAKDVDARTPVWEAMAKLFTSPLTSEALNEIGAHCVRSKYTNEELRAIYWNEIEPALASRMEDFWLWFAGTEDSIVDLVLERHRFERRIPKWRWLHPFANARWNKLSAAITSVPATESTKLQK